MLPYVGRPDPRALRQGFIWDSDKKVRNLKSGSDLIREEVWLSAGWTPEGSERCGVSVGG